MAPKSIFLSVIIPARNEEHRLPQALRAWAQFLDQQSYSAQIIVVNNGSTDATAAVVEAWQATDPRFILLNHAQPGKGRAVRQGMLEAQGSYRFICDADISMPVEQVRRFLVEGDQEWDVAIGTREHAESEVECPATRRQSGRLFNLLTRMIALPGFRDTQCGFKCFSAHAAEVIFGRQLLNGFIFDVEALFIARKHGLTIKEVPITWVHDYDTRVSLFTDGPAMIIDLLRIRRNDWQGKYR